MKRFPCYLLFFLVFLGGSGFFAAATAAAQTSYTIQAILLEESKGGATIRITGEGEPTYTAYQLFDPARLVIDLADARFAERFTPPRELPVGPISNLRAIKPTEGQPAMVRLELLLLENRRDYEVEAREQDLVVTLGPLSRPAPKIAPPQATEAGKRPPGPVTSAKQQPARTDSAAILADLRKHQPAMAVQEAIQPRIPALKLHLADPVPEPASAQTSPPETAPQSPPPPPITTSDSFTQGGYEGTPISIDYFKTDLHNVFRLFGEISNRNIVVDEEVRGTLTLALDNVPWDFALDIVLNLKNLQKEERFDTIVISPRNKELIWEAGGADTQLSIRAPELSLAIDQRLDIPPQRLQAQRLAREGADHERRQEHLKALVKYEQALQRWPDTPRLAERMAAISLVRLGNNARAVNFARQALHHDEDNTRAALLAAVAAANMQRTREAKEFFDHAISRPQPAAEALLSYAAFAEEHDSPHGALALLTRHQQIHGDTLESLIARARLLDKTGAAREAHQEYQAILHSGYDLPEDLYTYVVQRVATEGE